MDEWAWRGVAIAVAAAFAIGVYVGDVLLAAKLRRCLEHCPDWIAQAAEAAAHPGGPYEGVLSDRLGQLADAIEAAGTWIGLERSK